MDERLIGWARAVKARHRARLPVLWLFTDEVRLPDPLPAIAALPAGLCGVVFRHDAAPGRAALGAEVARLCQARRLKLVVAGDTRLAAALGAGVHLRGGRRARVRRANQLVTSSVHNVVELRRAQRAGAQILFISPAFATPSHRGEPALDACRWVWLARRAPAGKAYALGGISGHKIISLSTFCCGAAAISALIPKFHSNVM